MPRCRPWQLAPAAVFLLALALLGTRTAAVRPAGDELHESNQMALSYGGDCVYFVSAEANAAGEEKVEQRMNMVLEATGSSQRAFKDAVGKVRRVWVAPTRDSMATALIVMIKAFVLHPTYSQNQATHRHEENTAMPEFMVQGGLQDVPTASLEEGGSTSLQQYLAHVARRYGKERQLGGTADAAAVDKMVSSLVEAHRHYMNSPLRGNQVATSALDEYGKVHQVKLAMNALKDGETVLMVGSPRLASYLFMAHLSSNTANLPSLAMSYMTKRVQDFAPSGAVLVQWKPVSQGVAIPYFWSSLTYAPETLQLPNHLAAYHAVPFDEIEYSKPEVEAAKTFPEGAVWWAGLMEKRKQRTSWWVSKPKSRLIYVAWYPAPPRQSASQPPGAQVMVRQAAGWVIWLTPAADELKGREEVKDLQVRLQELPGGNSFVTMVGKTKTWRLDGGADVNRKFVRAVQQAQAVVKPPET